MSTLLLMCTLYGCHADVPASTKTAESVALSEDVPSVSHAITRDQPHLSQRIERSPPDDASFVRVTVARNENPGRIPVYFDVFLQRNGQDDQQLGSFALYPPDREDAYLIRLMELPRAGDRLKLRMSIAGQDSGADINIQFLPIELINQEKAASQP